MKRVVVVLVAVAMLLSVGGVAVLVALGPDDGGGPTGPSAPGEVPTTTPEPGATQPPSPELADFYGQTLTWSACAGARALCARLRVPLDYRHPDAETIELAVLKVPAEDPDHRIGSLVVNPGGPGAPGTEYAASARSAFRQPLREAYDVVGFDPRGTGASAPVDCLSDEQLDGYVAADPDPDTPDEVRSWETWLDELGRGCAERSGDLAGHVSTIEAARDMDVLRAALGESTLTYLGASYGTKLGATYADLFPDRAGRLVLDGAVDLSIGSRELSLQQATGFETALRAYVASCVDDGDCFLGDSVDAGAQRIREFIDAVDADPLPGDGERELEVGNAFYGIVLPLYSRDTWSYLSQALKAGLDGDGTLLLRFSDIYHSRGPEGYTDNSTEANYAISCLDDPYAVSADQVAAALPAFERASPTFGRVFAWGLTTCSGFPELATEEPREIRAAGAPPIVVVGTTRDPATPYEWSVHLADQLESGVLVTRDGDGHTGYNSGNACVDAAVEDYLLAGTAPEDGLAC